MMLPVDAGLSEEVRVHALDCGHDHARVHREKDHKGSAFREQHHTFLFQTTRLRACLQIIRWNKKVRERVREKKKRFSIGLL